MQSSTYGYNMCHCTRVQNKHMVTLLFIDRLFAKTAALEN